ncbi:MAG: tripartite tricarboxylate transporter substrate binding protein [Candidatus Competibacterales bacterium]
MVQPSVLRRGLFALVCSAVLALPAAAEYPDRPITLIVPWAAGGGTDTVSRMLASLMEREAGVPINVVNRTGGGGVVGHAAMMRARPDGYTLGMGTMEFTTYRPLGLADIGPDAFTLIARVAAIPAGVTVADDAPYEDLAALQAALAAGETGAMTSSGGGQGGAWHLAAAGWMKNSGLDPNTIRYIPSQGGAPALQDLVAGGLSMFTGSPVEAQALADAGRVRILAVMNPERVPAFPDVPTLQEAVGVEWSASTWFSLVGPAGLPDEVVAKVLEIAQKAHSSAEFQEFVAQRGILAVWQPGEEFAAFADEFAATMGALIGDLGLGR